MTPRTRAFLIGLILAAAAHWMYPAAAYAPGAGQPSPAKAPKAAAQRDAQFAPAIARAKEVAQEISARGIPGMAVAVAVNGEIVWAGGFGYADLESRVPASASTRWRIGSISKPLTAAALAVLIEEGKLNLDAPVQQYVPWFPVKGKPISTRMLAGHLAGIRHYKGQEFLNSAACSTVAEGLAIFQDDPLVHAPGTKFGYSSYGWNLISAVLEGASKEEFLKLIEQRVFQPLKMSSTTADRNGRIIENRAQFYSRPQDASAAVTFTNGPYVDNSCKWAGGGFLSTVEDLARFGSAHIRDGFLQPKTRELLFTTQHTAEGVPTGYGIGWQVGKDAAGRVTLSHGGGSVGGTSQLILWPDSRVVVAVLTNLTSAPYRVTDVHKIAEPFLK